MLVRDNESKMSIELTRTGDIVISAEYEGLIRIVRVVDEFTGIADDILRSGTLPPL